MGQSRAITYLAVLIVTLSAMRVAVAKDATWKDCELGARDPDRSIAACSKILKRSSNAAAFHHRALAFEAKGKLGEAISDVSAGMRLDPQPAYRWQKRGDLYARQGKYQQAIADISEAIRRDPTPRAFRFQSRADAYQSLGDLARAIADYDEAIRLDPEARSFRFRARANALRNAGQYERALADYATALKLDPTNVWALVDRGRTYARMGRAETAQNDFDKALTLDPSNAELRHAIKVEAAALPRQSPRTPGPSPQKAEGTAYAEIGWWSIDYLKHEDIVVGCHATSLFKDQTLLSMALVHTDEGRNWFIRIRNPAWKSWIKKEKQHTLRFVSNKTWQSTFFVSADQEFLYSEDLSVDFMNSIADAKSLEVFDENNRSLASFDMRDSKNAIKAVVNCAREHARGAREAQTTPQETPQEGSGTGFFIAPNLLMTNKHVVDGCRTINVRYPDQTPTTARISGQDRTNDLALLRTSMHGQSVASFRLGPRLGEAVATYGFPYRGILSSSGNFTLGNVTSMTGIADDTRFFQMSTPIQPGNSGGPLLDMSGAVVGVVVSQLSAAIMMEVGNSVPQNVNFAIHAAVATNFLSIKGVRPELSDTSSAAPQALSPSDVADMAKKFTVQVICEGASQKMAKGDVPVAVVADIMKELNRPQASPEMGALSGHLAAHHSRHLLQTQWRRVNRENTP